MQRKGSFIFLTLFQHTHIISPATSLPRWWHVSSNPGPWPALASLELGLIHHLARGQYCKAWHLYPSPAKTLSIVYHLWNADAAKQLDIRLGGWQLRHTLNPTHLGITLDRTLSFKELLKEQQQRWNSKISQANIYCLVWEICIC